MAATTNTNDGKTRTLLGLPAELRNQVYRLALCETGKIAISQNNFQQPALLRTCRQIREEASSIYSGENQITVLVHNLNASVALSWCQHSGRYASEWCKKIAVNLGHFSSTRNWGNLMRWVKHSTDRRVFGLDQGEKRTPWWNVAAGAFAIAQRLHDAHMEWAEIEKVLEIYKVSTKYTVEWEDQEV